LLNVQSGELEAMHPKVATGTVAIYARYSSDLQHEASIEDQARRAHEAIARAGGDPSKAVLFPDFAISGASMARPALDALLRAVEAKQVDVIITEDVSRISRDMADAAQIFKRLRFANVPLISLSDGLDTSSKHAKMTFAIKSMFAEQYLDELADKTLRGLEGRMLAGFATGLVPYGYRTVAETDRSGRTVHRIEIDEKEAPVVQRIFSEYQAGGTLHGIARALNREGIPSPRAGTKHKRFGWGSSSIRAILYNDRYSGTWRFKERQWVKVPGTNKRQPRNRPPEEVMTMERPELRIIDAEIWAAVREQLTATHRKYTRKSDAPAGSRRRCTYMLSGVLMCDECGFPLVIYANNTRAYYRCSTHHTKGTCENELKVREDIVRETTLGAIRDSLQSPDAIAHIRKHIAERLRDHSKSLDAELRETRERLKRTEERISGLVSFIAEGERSEYVVTGLRDMEVQAKADRAAIDRLQREASEPLRLPSLDEITSAVFRFDALLDTDPNDARARLRRWLPDGQVRVARTTDGFEVKGAINPLALSTEAKNQNESGNLPNSRGSLVAGARIWRARSRYH
jgi:DNA invertase Pin-like site-specific DNA recombinase